MTMYNCTVAEAGISFDSFLWDYFHITWALTIPSNSSNHPISHSLMRSVESLQPNRLTIGTQFHNRIAEISKKEGDMVKNCKNVVNQKNTINILNRLLLCKKINIKHSKRKLCGKIADTREKRDCNKNMSVPNFWICLSMTIFSSSIRKERISEKRERPRNTETKISSFIFILYRGKDLNWYDATTAMENYKGKDRKKLNINT